MAEEVIEKKTKNTKKDYVAAVGRRREAVARVRLYAKPVSLMVGEQELKKGDMFVNAQPIEKYFSGTVAKQMYMQSFEITNTVGNYAATIKVVGGGKNGQLFATVHAIARALSIVDIKHRGLLKKKGLLTRDARTRQRRNVGMAGKSRRKKQSPKR